MFVVESRVAGARRLEGSHDDVTVLMYLCGSVVDESKIRQRGKAGEFKRQPGRARSELPSHLHSDSPKSQHCRRDAANGRACRRNRPSALVLSELGGHHVRAASREVLQCVSQCWGLRASTRGQRARATQPSRASTDAQSQRRAPQHTHISGGRVLGGRRIPQAKSRHHFCGL